MGIFPRKSIWACSVAATVLAISPAAYAETRTFNLASQDAAQAIPEFARQAGLQIVAPADQLKGFKTPAIRGAQDVRAALRRLLAGTGLIIAADDGEVITLRRSEKAENGAPGGAARISPAAGRALPAAAMSEVIVTATKTGATNLQKTPLAVSVVSSADLVKRGAANVMGLPELVPSLKVTLNSINPQIYIRGVGGFQGQESEVSVYMDDIYIARLSTIMESNFTDLDRVEVIEGPQGTVFGRNSTGGAINFISRTPSKAFRFDNSLSLGNYSLIDQAATVSGPVSETVQASFSARYYKHDGYQKNIVAGVGNPGAADRFSARGQLRWEVTPDIADTLRADYLFADEAFGSNVLRLATPYPTVANTIIGQYDKIANDTLAHATEIVYGLSNELNWKFSDHVSLKSITAARTDHSTNLQDGDGTEVPTSISGKSYYMEHTLSQEFNLVHNYGPLSGVAGLYYFEEQSHQIGNVYSPAGNIGRPDENAGRRSFQDTRQPTVSHAMFAHETYKITPSISLTAGLRYTEEKKRLNTLNTVLIYNPGGANNGATAPPLNGAVFPFVADLGKKAYALTPKIGIDWQVSNDAMIYASATNGYKSGGYSNTARAVFGADFGPESIWAYEIGAKSSWFDHRLRVNLAAFHYDWTGLQFAASIAPTISATSNAGMAELNGFEADIAANPLDGLTLSASTVLLDSRYEDFKAYSVPAMLRQFLLADSHYNATAQTYNSGGKTLVNAPRVTLNLGAEQDFALSNGGDVRVRIDYQHTSRTYFDPTNVALASRPNLSLLGASLSYRPLKGRWEAAVWGKNLTDARYVNGISAGGNGTSSVGAPRTYGLRLDYTY